MAQHGASARRALHGRMDAKRSCKGWKPDQIAAPTCFGRAGGASGAPMPSQEMNRIPQIHFRGESESTLLHPLLVKRICPCPPSWVPPATPKHWDAARPPFKSNAHNDPTRRCFAWNCARADWTKPDQSGKQLTFEFVFSFLVVGRPGPSKDLFSPSVVFFFGGIHRPKCVARRPRQKGARPMWWAFSKSRHSMWWLE